MTLRYFWQVAVTCLPAAACAKHDSQMCRQPGDPEVLLRHEPMDIGGNGQEASSQKTFLNKARLGVGISLLSQNH